ncbi:hypothetical protein [Pararhodobacter sp.]|uniref:hypothetical protein n=1 Tax=Pararhodobacter sp. TaxID=2127056 RepID=UPI002FDE3405
MSAPRGTVFLERDSYRRRRIMDGARILPVAGFVLILLPVLWSFGNGANIAAEAVYLFVLWCVLIGAAAILARPLRSGLKRDTPPALPPAPGGALDDPATGLVAPDGPKPDGPDSGGPESGGTGSVR